MFTTHFAQIDHIGSANTPGDPRYPLLQNINTGGYGTDVTVVADTLFFYPIFVNYARSFTEIAADVATLFSVDLLIRLGIYSVNQTTGGPGIKLADSGEMHLVSGSVYRATINAPLDPGPYFVCYWGGTSIQMEGFGSSLYTGLGVKLNGSTIRYLLRNKTFDGTALPFDESGQTHTAGTSGTPFFIGIR